MTDGILHEVEWNPYGYPECCVEAFHAYSEAFMDGRAGQRDGIHCYIPCDDCLERAPMEQLWAELVERRGYGCVDALLHLITYVEPDYFHTAQCDDCVGAQGLNETDPAEARPESTRSTDEPIG